MFIQRLLVYNILEFLIITTDVQSFVGHTVMVLHYQVTMERLTSLAGNFQYIILTATSFFLLKHFLNLKERSSFCIEQIIMNQNFNIKIESEGVKNERDKVKAEASNLKEQVALANLDNNQKKMIQEKGNDLESKIPERFRLDWKDIKFKKRLGSGSFGVSEQR